MNKHMTRIFAVLALGLASLAQAAPLNIVGALSNTDPTFNRPLSGTPPPILSGVGTNVSFDAYQFFVDTTGSYRMETLSASLSPGDADDTFLVLYLGSSFNPATPLVNALAANDDSGSGALSLINLNLSANTNYLLVVTSFNNGAFGNYTGVIAANDGNAGNVFGGTVPTNPGGNVPVPGTTALLSLGLLALVVRRRRSC
jgi:hypothetical protein